MSEGRTLFASGIQQRMWRFRHEGEVAASSAAIFGKVRFDRMSKPAGQETPRYPDLRLSLDAFAAFSGVRDRGRF